MHPCLPGEFERQSAILLDCNELALHHPQAMVEVIGSLVGHIPIIVTIDSEDRRQHLITLLCDWGVATQGLHYVCLPARGVWMREYGPGFVRGADERFSIVDAGKCDPPDEAAVELAKLLRVPVRKPPLTVDGSNLISNGRGLCIATTRLLEQNQHRGYDEPSVRALLKEFYGCTQCIFLEPLLSEPSGHVDLFAAFIAPDTLMLGEYAPGVDPANAQVLERDAELLSRVRVGSAPLNVVRIPMPSNAGGIWRTYTSIIFGNGRLLVPRYAECNGSHELRAMQLYASLLRGWEIVAVDVTTMAQCRGTLRGASINIPFMGDSQTTGLHL